MNNEKIKKILDENKNNLNYDFLQNIIDTECLNDKDKEEFLNFLSSYLNDSNPEVYSNLENQIMNKIDSEIDKLCNLVLQKKYSETITSFEKLNIEIEKSFASGFDSISSSNIELVYFHTPISSDVYKYFYSKTCELIDLPFDYPKFLNNYSICLFNLNRADEAILKLREAMRFDRFYLPTYINKADFDFKLRNELALRNDFELIHENLFDVNYFKDYSQFLQTYVIEDKDIGKAIFPLTFASNITCNSYQRFASYIDDENLNALKSKGIYLTITDEMKNCLISLYKKYVKENDVEKLKYFKDNLLYELELDKELNIINEEK